MTASFQEPGFRWMPGDGCPGDGCPGAGMTSPLGPHVKEGRVKQSQAVSVRRPVDLALFPLQLALGFLGCSAGESSGGNALLRPSRGENAGGCMDRESSQHRGRKARLPAFSSHFTSGRGSGTKLLRLGISTLGNAFASITASLGTMPFSESI